MRQTSLLRAEPCTMSLSHTGTHITWTIRSAPFLPLHTAGAPNLFRVRTTSRPYRHVGSQLMLDVLVPGDA
jgi:hypothetical protein